MAPEPESPSRSRPTEDFLRRLSRWNETDADFPLDRCFHHLFGEQVQRAPERIAAVCNDHEITYEELDLSADALAQDLLARGLAPEELVALLADRSLEFLVAILAVFKAGGAYLPLDTTHPAERWRQVLDQSRCPFVLTAAPYRERLAATVERLPPEQRPEVSLLPAAAALRDPREPRPVRPARAAVPDDLAYVIFTSGSTGRPKGAMVEHRGMLNHLFAKVADLELSAEDRIVQNASQCFDISVWQFLAALLTGGQVHVFPDAMNYDPRHLLAAVKRHRISILEVVPSFLKALLDEIDQGEPPELGTLRWVLVTGEALPPGLCRRWLARYPEIPLLNAYGPTECSDDVSHHAIRVPPEATVVHMPIGRPIANTKLYVTQQVGESLELSPEEEAGELCVGGVGVGRGYLRDPERTAAAFLDDPFSGAAGARLYRTGDLARFLPNGEIEYLGRIDRQVKIRGFRIELGEIESVLSRHDAVADCAVEALAPCPMASKLVARDYAAEVEPGELVKRLVAYLVSRQPVADEELRRFLGEVLPHYMIPERFVRLARMPLNENGKIDHKALAVPESFRPELNEPYLAPRDELEKLLAGIVADVLRLDRAGVHDNLFDLGCDSLLAIQILNRVRRSAGIDLSFSELFEAPSVARLAARTGWARQHPPPQITSHGAPRHDRRYPLSLAQQGLWFLWKMEPDSSYYTFQGILSVRGALDLPAFLAAWDVLLARHAVLRARYVAEDGTPYQVFDRKIELPRSVTDLSHLAAAQAQAELRRQAREVAAVPFDLEQDPLLRLELFRLSGDEHALLLTTHEILLDGWATCVLIEELATLYEALLERQEQPLPPLELHLSDFTLWERDAVHRQALEREATYWQKKLGGELPVLDLPLDRPRSTHPTYRGASHATLLDETLSTHLRALALQLEATPFMVLLAAFYVLLYRYSDQDDLVVGAPLANRSQEGTEDMVGFFLNMLPLRCQVAETLPFSQLVRQTRQSVVDAVTHARYPLIFILEDVNTVRESAFAPLFQVMFNMLNFPYDEAPSSQLELAFHELDTGFTKYDLALYAQEHGSRFRLQLAYLADLFDDANVERMLTGLTCLLGEATADPRRQISLLSLLAESERSQILAASRGVPRGFVEGQSVTGLFERQATETPDATALCCHGEPMSYAELNRRANQLARHLRRCGAGRETIVGVCVDRSFDTIVALLGILKAGSAFLPLDDSYPAARLAAMIEDARPPILVVNSRVRPVAGFGGHVVSLDADGHALAQEDPTDPGGAADPDQLFAVIYTSSTTGSPKGSLITLGAALNRLGWMWEAYPFEPRDVAALHKSYALIGAIWECFGALLQGVATFILSREQVEAPPRLWRELLEHGVSYLLASPPVLELVLAQAEANPADALPLRLAASSAEAIPPALVRRWQRAFPSAPLLNLYGSTECSSNIMTYDTADLPANAARTPVGRPLPNVAVYSLDRSLRLVPPVVVGGMYVGGVCLARGYLARPGQTALAFVPDPYSTSPGGRLYQTGDLVRQLADGQLEFLGRHDQQVKIRGFRVELDEVEATLARHDSVAKCAVVPVVDAQGRSSLLALAIARREVAPLELRDFMRENLPEFMVPRSVSLVDTLPLTPSGKIARHLLSLSVKSYPSDAATTVPTAPQTPLQESLAEIWSQVLGVESVGIHDDFFDLGGHSLLGMQLITRVHAELGVEVGLHSVYDHSTVAGMAKAVEALGVPAELVAAAAADSLPETPAEDWEEIEI